MKSPVLIFTAFTLLTTSALTLSAQAGEADVVDAKVRKTGAATYSFAVTVKHADTGWDHYADAWEVVGPDGTVISTRVLAHPHVGEQPFTRSKSGIKIDPSIQDVTIRAKDSVHGYGGRTLTVRLPE